MKILELADLIERCNDCKYNQDAATMIRKLEGQLAFRIDAVTKYQAWVQELEISKQSWEIIAKGYGKTIDEQQAEIDKANAEWVRASTALVNAVNEIRQQQAEIKRLTQENCDLWEQLNDGKASEK